MSEGVPIIEDLPGRPPDDAFTRKCAENAEREMRTCMICGAEGRIRMRKLGHDSILVCTGCGSVYEAIINILKCTLYMIKVRSVGDVKGMEHFIGKEYNIPLDLKGISEDREKRIPGKPPTLKSSMKREGIVRAAWKNCIMCMKEDSLRMRDLGFGKTLLVCTECHATYRPYFSVFGSKFNSFKVVSTGTMQKAEGFVGRHYQMPLVLEDIQEDLVMELPGDPPRFEGDLKFDAEARAVVHACLVCGNNATIRLRKLKGLPRLVCRDCHSVFQALPGPKMKGIGRLIIKSTGRIPQKKSFEGKVVDLEVMKRSPNWRKMEYPPIEQVRGSTHGDHWGTVLGDGKLESLFDAQVGSKVSMIGRYFWRGHNAEHRKVMDNDTAGVTSLHDDVRIIAVSVNKTLWTSYPASYHYLEVDAVIDKISLWSAGIEGWLHFNFDVGSSRCALSGFDPLFFIHRGKIEKTTKLGLLGFAYQAEKGMDHDITNERTLKERHVFPEGKARITADSGWFIPMAMMRENMGFTPDDFSVRMKVVERTDVKIFDGSGYLYKGLPFGAGSKPLFPIIVRKESIRGDPPDVGESLFASIWLQSYSMGCRTNGLEIVERRSDDR